MNQSDNVTREDIHPPTPDPKKPWTEETANGPEVFQYMDQRAKEIIRDSRKIAGVPSDLQRVAATANAYKRGGMYERIHGAFSRLYATLREDHGARAMIVGVIDGNGDISFALYSQSPADDLAIRRAAHNYATGCSVYCPKVH